MRRHRLPPIFMPGVPSSHPAMTCDAPIWEVEGVRPAGRLESNEMPLDCSQPVYWTSAFSPLFATSPVPTLRSPTFRPSGYVTAAMLLQLLKSSAPGEGLAEADATGLSSATGAVAAEGAGDPAAAQRRR